MKKVLIFCFAVLAVISFMTACGGSEDKIFGETVFLDKTPSEKDNTCWCKRELMKIWDVTIEDCGYKGNDYKVFYKKAYDCLKKEVGERTKK